MTQYHPDKHHRRSIRLKGYDYTQTGGYFVTIVTHERELLFDDPVLRRVAETLWQRIPRHFPHVKLDEWVVMPNHIHGVLWVVAEVGARHPLRTVPVKTLLRVDERPEQVQDDVADASPLLVTGRPVGPPSGSLGAIIGNLKSVTTRRINGIRKTPGAPVWQRNYYERVIRNERELNAIRQYIQDNPAHWAEDSENPNRILGLRHSSGVSASGSQPPPDQGSWSNEPDAGNA